MKIQATKIKEVLFYLLAFVLPCFIYGAPIVILLYIITWLVEGNLKAKIIVALRNKYVLLFCSFYLLHLIGLLYTSNFDEGWFDLEVKLSLFIFPIMLVSEGEMPFDKQKKFILLFLTGLICNGCVCIGYALWRLWEQHIYIFQYKLFSLFMHPSYYSMYIDMALVMMFYLFTCKEELNELENIFLCVAIFFLEFMLVLLQSKTGLIVSSLVLIVLLAKYTLKTRKWMNTFALVIGLYGVYYVTNRYVITSNNSRIASAEDNLSKGKPDANTTESSQVRILVWQSAWKVIKQNPVIGVGTGNVSNVLLGEYAKDGVEGALREKLNAHDQYIQTTLALGAIGLLLLLTNLLVPLYKSVKEHRFVYTMFILILMVNFLTESMFQTQGGTMYYGLFNSLFMFNFVI